MAVLIDPPRWPAHGTIFAHLVSDSSLDELHSFAGAAGVPPRAFDHDHYDVPERRYADLVARGAEEVSSTELVRRLVRSGLRTRTPERTPKRSQVRPLLAAGWATLLPGQEWLGAQLLERWSEEHRHYHDVRHLAQCLAAFDLGAAQGPVDDTVRLAAWFHDAVYEGTAGADEEASAALAEELLPRASVSSDEVTEVARLVRLTAHHAPASDDLAGQQLCDADLSILGQAAGRYHVYVRDIRLEYGHVSDELFRVGRLQVLERLLALNPLFHTPTARRLWAATARTNLEAERRRWLAEG